MSAQPNPAGDTRAALLDAAKKVFAEKGYDGATVKELAETAGVNVSLVSYHFQGKEGLYRAVLENFGMEGLRLIERILIPATSKEDFRVRLQLFVEEFFDFHMRDADFSMLVHREMETGFTHAREVFHNVFQRTFDLLVRFISSGQEQAILRKDLVPEITASFVFGALKSICMADKLRQQICAPSLCNIEDRKVYVQQCLDIISRGVVL